MFRNSWLASAPSAQKRKISRPSSVDEIPESLEGCEEKGFHELEDLNLSNEE